MRNWKREDWFLFAMSITAMVSMVFAISVHKEMEQASIDSKNKIKALRNANSFLGTELTKE